MTYQPHHSEDASLKPVAQQPAAAPAAPAVTPIDMLLFCPKCGMQHVDAPETTWKEALIATGRLHVGQQASQEVEEAHARKWTNPPHRSHKCHGCGCIWRPADVPTNGVAALKTKGKADTWALSAGAAQPAAPSPVPLAVGRFHQFPADEDGGDWEWFDRGTNCDTGCVDAVILSQADYDKLLAASKTVAPSPVPAATAVLASFAHEVTLGAYSEDELPDAAMRALRQAGFPTLDAVLLAAPQPALDREELAEFYKWKSRKEVHTNDCATSRAPAEIPGPCDCAATQPAAQEGEHCANCTTHAACSHFGHGFRRCELAAGGNAQDAARNRIVAEACKLVDRLKDMALHPSHYAELRAAIDAARQGEA